MCCITLLGISYFLLIDVFKGGSQRKCYWERSVLDFAICRLCFLLGLLFQVTEKLLEVENETMMKVADLEKLLLQKDKDLQVIRVSWQPSLR